MASFLSHEILLRESPGHLLLLVFLASLSTRGLASSEDEQVFIQKFHIYQASTRCSAILANVTLPEEPGLYCEPVWDDVMCWPHYVKAGENATQPCPTYIQGFNPSEQAVRSCTADGTWGDHPSAKLNNSWTDFGRCIRRMPGSPVPAIIEENMPIVIRISTIGYSISLGTLMVATAIMVFFKRLHCQRNTIHINLFISFMFRAVISLLRNTLLVKHFALPSDIKYAEDGTLLFVQEGTHWECKLLNTLWQYSLNANYMWIFVEGLYLHTLIFFAVFSQSKRFFKLYILIGWVLPLIFIIIWILVRIFKNNTLCWNTHDFGYYWILNAPIVSSISVNFFFFLNIIRVLFTKIRDCNTRDPRRYRKLAKSTLVLIPLFGVYYIFFIALNAYQEPKIAIVHMYMEMTLNSFQGTVVALLFCFLNGEVRAEIMKKWHRHWLRRQSVVSGRSSRAFSTTSYYVQKERASLSLGIPLCDVKCKESKSSSPPSSLNNNNGGIFRKVSSMPKMSVNSSSAAIKPLPRVSSTSKVTFDCANRMTDQNIESSGWFPDVEDLDTESKKVCNGSLDYSKAEEMKSLLSDNSKANKGRHSLNDMCKLPVKAVHLDIRTFKTRGHGVVHDGNSTLSQEQTINILPPLSDVDEDYSDTTSSVN